MEDPLVSVLIPAYNAAAYIRPAISAVLNQTYQNFELIIVNDGSLDQTAELVKEFARGDSRIRFYEQANRGQAAACNFAYLQSRGEYIKFFDADDYMSENMLFDQVSLLQHHPDKLAYSAWGRFYGSDYQTAVFKPDASWRDLPPLEWLLANLGEGQQMLQAGTWLIPRAVLERAGLWDERLSLINDLDFFVRIVLASRGIRFSADTRLYYRSGIAKSLSRQMSREAAQSAKLSVELGAAAILKTEESARTKSLAARLFTQWAYSLYPHQKDLAEQLFEQAERLGGSNFMPPGGKLFRFAAKLFGARKATCLRQLRYRWGGQ